MTAATHILATPSRSPKLSGGALPNSDNLVAPVPLKPTMTRRDSRARPPPIRVETSSPPKAMTLLPAVQVNGHHDHDHHDHGHGSHAHGNGCSHGHGNGHGNGNGHSHSHDDDADEEKDNVGDLPPTPSRHSFHGASLAALMGERPTTPTRESGRPSSPSSPWSPLEAATSPARRTQPLARPPSWHRNSLEVPSFVGAEPRRFEPTPTHGLHARNLSTYFPHPGVPLPPASPTLEGAEQVIPQGDRTAFGGPQDWQFGESPTGEMEGGEQMRRGKRRGHHHRHSLSHNFFSFLDPTQTAMAPPDSPVALLSPTTPKPMPMDFASPLTASLSPLPENKTDPQKQALGWFGVIESVLGVALWIEGQSSGWHCLTAVGYLVVFDAMGMAINMFSKAEAGWRTLRRPYGASRLTSLLCFSQSLFLLFAAVYIAKESLETAVLGPGGHDHGGSHGHGDHTVGDERPFPLLLLALASIASLFSGAVLGNNRRLLEATGELFLPDSYLDLVEPGTFLANPYTLSIAGTTAALLLAGLIMPSSSLRGFDSGMSLALTLLTGALAWPPAVAFAQILLQTAPPAASGQMKALRSALREVADDRRVLGLGTFRCWAINAGKPVPADVPAAPDAEAPAPPVIVSKPRHAASPSVSAFLRTDNDSLGLFMQDKSQEAVAHVPLVVTLVVHVHPETTDADVLDLSRVAWARLNGAVNRGIADGEVSVQVRRGWEGVNE